jgi:hypothetical protein
MDDFRPRMMEAEAPGARMDGLCAFIEFWLGPRQPNAMKRRAARRSEGEMNHGVVMFRREGMPESRIWQMAMGQGKFVAVYSPRSMERWGEESDRELWSSALVPTAGAALGYPSVFESAGHGADYARYEPAYDDEFLRMCQGCSGAPYPTVVLPAAATDEQAMRLLGDLDSIRYGA